MWGFWMVVLCPLTESLREQPPTEMTGILGGSITFQPKTSEKFASLSWLRTREGRPVIFASVDVGRSCTIKFHRLEFVGRLSVSRDCRDLQISNLKQGDSGSYTAQIADYSEDFRLNVYENLLESDLEIRCENEKQSDGSYTLQLNCSAEKWEDGVDYSWTSPSKDGKISSQVVQIEDFDANYTCMAANPVSKASRTVSTKLACEGIKGFAVGAPSYVQIGATIAALIAAKVIINVLVALKFLSGTKQRDAPEKTG